MIRLLVASSEVQVNHTEAFDSAVTSIDTRYGTALGGQTLKSIDFKQVHIFFL
jgi:hypothetical protein